MVIAMRLRKIITWTGSIIGVLVGLVLILAVVGYALPEQVQWVDTEVTLEAQPEELFPLFNSREGQQRLWTRASERSGPDGFPAMRIADLGGPAAGVGCRMGFFPADGEESLEVIAGEGVIVRSDAARRVEYEIDFGVVVAHRTFTLTVVDGGTVVHWGERLTATNPLMRYALLAGGDGAFNEEFRAVLAGAGELVNAAESP